MTKREASVVSKETIEELLKEAAHNFIYPHARFCMYDNGEDMTEADMWAETWEWLNGKLPKKDRYPNLVEYIKGYLADEIQKAKDDAVEPYEDEWRPMVAQFLDEKSSW